MNARLYDPVIGRFFSLDPVIQAYELTQILNRYSFCQNLSCTAECEEIINYQVIMI
jgi:RHS repeat-associated protein